MSSYSAYLTGNYSALGSWSRISIQKKDKTYVDVIEAFMQKRSSRGMRGGSSWW